MSREIFYQVGGKTLKGVWHDKTESRQAAEARIVSDFFKAQEAAERQQGKTARQTPQQPSRPQPRQEQAQSTPFFQPGVVDRMRERINAKQRQIDADAERMRGRGGAIKVIQKAVDNPGNSDEVADILGQTVEATEYGRHGTLKVTGHSRNSRGEEVEIVEGQWNPHNDWRDESRRTVKAAVSPSGSVEYLSYPGMKDRGITYNENVILNDGQDNISTAQYERYLDDPDYLRAKGISYEERQRKKEALAREKRRDEILSDDYRS